MLDRVDMASKGLEKAQLKFAQAKQKLAEEMAKTKEERRRIQTHYKCVMGGLVAKYFPECYQFEERELSLIIGAAIQSQDCRSAIKRIRDECGKSAIAETDESRTKP